jgi:hypothetical protein
MQTFLAAKEKAFAALRSVHPEVMSSNVNSKAALKPGVFVIALHPRGGIILVQGNLTLLLYLF